MKSWKRGAFFEVCRVWFYGKQPMFLEKIDAVLVSGLWETVMVLG